jgi:hypothetical protein
MPTRRQTEIKINEHHYTMNNHLYENLQILKNSSNDDDWDFKIIISGDGMTRTGKTTIAGQIGKVLDPSSTEENWVYGGENLIKTAKKLGKNKVVFYDEAKEGLDAKKIMSQYSQHLVSYMNECGYLNQFLIIILPDFFDLNKSVALNLSMTLINCRVKGDLETKKIKRGFFHLWARPDKKKLYLRGKKELDYKAYKATVEGTFSKYFPYDYKILEEKKKKAIEKRDKEMGLPSKREQKWRSRCVKAWRVLQRERKWTRKEISELFSTKNDYIDLSVISKAIIKDEMTRDI